MGATGRTWRACGLVVAVGLHAAGGWAMMPGEAPLVAGEADAPVLEAVLIDEPAPEETPVAVPEPLPSEPPPPLPDPVPPEPDPPPQPDPVPSDPPPPEPVPESPPPPAPEPAITRPEPPPPSPKPKPARPKPRPSAAVSASPPQPAPPAAEPPPAPKAEEPRRDPAVISCRVPAYPAESRRLGETGTVTLSLLVGPDGDVLDKRVDVSSGHDRLDAAALDALAKCRFKPGGRDGRAETTWAKLRYVWKLN